MVKPELTFDEWVTTVPTLVSADPVWSVKAYRLALYVADIGWGDVTHLVGDDRTKSLSDQLYRALGSISANIEEGYSRGSDKDRTRFYEYALGSARESRGWYYKGRHVLGENVMLARMDILSQVIRLLLTMSGNQRGYRVHEGEEPYAFADGSTGEG
jgi:four helix bundle protein